MALAFKNILQITKWSLKFLSNIAKDQMGKIRTDMNMLFCFKLYSIIWPFYLLYFTLFLTCNFLFFIFFMHVIGEDTIPPLNLNKKQKMSQFWRITKEILSQSSKTKQTKKHHISLDNLLSRKKVIFLVVCP